MRTAMCLLLVGLGFLTELAANQSSLGISPAIIPSKAYQANLLLNVQEVFEQVKLLTKDEADFTNTSVVKDVELMVKRAEYTLDLLHHITQLRLSQDVNTVCSLDARQQIRELTLDAKDVLRNCTSVSAKDIATCNSRLAEVVDTAIKKGQGLLDSLLACSNKSGLSVIPCYKKVIDKDVVAVKNVLLGAIEAHRSAHVGTIEVRKAANTCVDDTVARYRGLIDESLEEARKCDV